MIEGSSLSKRDELTAKVEAVYEQAIKEIDGSAEQQSVFPADGGQDLAAAQGALAVLERDLKQAEEKSAELEKQLKQANQDFTNAEDVYLQAKAKYEKVEKKGEDQAEIVLLEEEYNNANYAADGAAQLANQTQRNLAAQEKITAQLRAKYNSLITRITELEKNVSQSILTPAVPVTSTTPTVPASSSEPSQPTPQSQTPAQLPAASKNAALAQEKTAIIENDIGNLLLERFSRDEKITQEEERIKIINDLTAILIESFTMILENQEEVNETGLTKLIDFIYNIPDLLFTPQNNKRNALEGRNITVVIGEFERRVKESPLLQKEMKAAYGENYYAKVRFLGLLFLINYLRPESTIEQKRKQEDKLRTDLIDLFGDEEVLKFNGNIKAIAHKEGQSDKDIRILVDIDVEQKSAKEPAASSSLVDADNGRGGIDLTHLPAAVMSNPAVINPVSGIGLTPALSREIFSINLNQECGQIEKMMAADIAVSDERLRVLMIVCCRSASSSVSLDKMRDYIAFKIRIDEKFCRPTNTALLKMLELLELNQPPEVMINTLASLSIAPK